MYFLTKINHFAVSFCHKVVDFSVQMITSVDG